MIIAPQLPRCARCLVTTVDKSSDVLPLLYPAHVCVAAIRVYCLQRGRTSLADSTSQRYCFEPSFFAMKPKQHPAGKRELDVSNPGSEHDDSVCRRIT
jgi:hypothetical protein